MTCSTASSWPGSFSLAGSSKASSINDLSSELPSALASCLLPLRSQHLLQNLGRAAALLQGGHERQPDVALARIAEVRSGRHHHTALQQPQSEALRGLALRNLNPQ